MLAACLHFALLNRAVDGPLKFPTIVARLDVLVPKLGEAAGEPMVVDPRLANDVVAVAADGETLKSVMDALAKATNAGWVKRDGKFSLEQTSEQIDTEKKNLLTERIKAIQEEIDTTIKKNADESTFTQSTADDYIKTIRAARPKDQNMGRAAQTFYKQLNKGPQGLLMYSALTQLGAANLAKVIDGKRVVYSSKPNRSQIQLPGDFRKQMAQIVQQLNLLAMASSKYPLPEDGVRYSGEEYNQVTDFVKFDMSIYNRMDSLDIRILGFSSDGKTVVRANSNFSIGGFRGLQKSFENPGGTHRFTLSPAATTLMKLVQRIPGTDPTPVTKIFYDAPKEEPLQIGNTEAIDQLSQLKKMPVVATIPEIMIAAVAFQGAGTLETYQSMMEAFDKKVDDGHWLVWQAKFPEQDRLARSDRKGVADIAKSLSSAQNLDARAALAAKYPDLSTKYMCMVAGFINPENGSSLMNETEQGWLRFYGNLSEDHRKALRTGLALASGDLTKGERTALQDMVFNAPYFNISFDYQEAGPSFDYQKANNFQSGLGSEATEVCPDGGLPQNLKVDCMFHEQKAFFADLGGYQGMAPLEPGNLASNMAFQSSSNGQPPMVPFDQATYYNGTQRSYSFRLWLMPSFYMMGSLNDHMIDKSKKLKKADIPDDFWKQLDDMVKQYKEWNIGAGRGKAQP